MVKVFLVDDHSVFRSGVRAELSGQVDIVGDAGTVAEAIAGIDAARPDVVLLDVHMPDGGGLAVLRGVSSDPVFLALSVSDAAEDVISLIRAGARGYVTKNISGTELAEGEPFLIVVSQGPTLRPLPDSTGKTLDQALIALQEIAMVAEPTETHHEVVPSGTVISWSVPADATLTTGSEVLPGTVVELVVSQGPAPREVPQLVGVAVDGARTAIESRQLVFTVAPEQEFSDDIAAGSVLWQSVEAGQMVERDSEVVVVLSKGPDVVPFPDISGAADYDAAEAILEEAGFTATLTFGDKQGPVQEYTIDGETPEVGQTFKRGTLVEITAFAETADDPTG